MKKTNDNYNLLFGTDLAAVCPEQREGAPGDSATMLRSVRAGARPTSGSLTRPRISRENKVAGPATCDSQPVT
jgi:hypothetical protein